MTRFDFAALAYVSDGFVGNCEAGRFANIPTSLLESLTPYLGGIGLTPEALQADYRAWRAGLSSAVRHKADRYCMLLARFPGIDVAPTDTDTIERFLSAK